MSNIEDVEYLKHQTDPMAWDDAVKVPFSDGPSVLPHSSARLLVQFFNHIVEN
jgi:hypothetical protein